MEQPKLAFVFEIRVDVSEGVCELGATPKGTRRIIPLCGGTFEGSFIKGTISPGIRLATYPFRWCGGN